MSSSLSVKFKVLHSCFKSQMVPIRLCVTVFCEEIKGSAVLCLIRRIIDTSEMETGTYSILELSILVTYPLDVY